MSEETHDDVIKRARQIVDYYADPKAADELIDELQRQGIIDAEGRVLVPMNGSCRNGSPNDHPPKG